MLKIQIINDDVYEKFMQSSDEQSFYQSLEWKNLKEQQGKKCELIGFYEDKKLLAVSLIIYVKIMRKYYYAYSSRGIVGDKSNLIELKNALIDYFKNKNIVFFRMDPLVVLNSYNSKQEKTSYNNEKMIDELKNVGFIHYGFNQGFETTQFRFIHQMKLTGNYEELYNEMSKSTKKNIEIASNKGVCIETSEDISKVYDFFKQTEDRKNITSFSEQFYKNIKEVFKDNCIMYLVYIDKEKYLTNLNKELNTLTKDQKDLKTEMEHSHIGAKLLKREEIINNKLKTINEEIEEANKMKDKTYIASMLTIVKYNEVVSLASGMDNNYRKFCPKYVMYPKMIKDAIDKKLKTVNFLGIANIFDKLSSEYGVYEVKRGFGGEAIEYIGEFDLPINKTLYKVYKLKNKIWR